MIKSPFWFFTETEEPYRDIGDKYISRIEEVFIGIWGHSEEGEESREPSEQPRYSIFCFRMTIEFRKDSECSHNLDESIGREDEYSDTFISKVECC